MTALLLTAHLIGRNLMLTATNPLICPECGRPAEAGPPTATTVTDTPAWRHLEDSSPLCPTTAVHPVGDMTVVPATGWYGPTETVQAAAALRAAAGYLDHALTAPVAEVALPRPDDLARLLADLHEATGRLAAAVEHTAARQRRFADRETGPHAPARAASGRLLVDRLTDASAQLAVATRTLHGIGEDHRSLHCPHKPADADGREVRGETATG